MEVAGSSVAVGGGVSDSVGSALEARVAEGKVVGGGVAPAGPVGVLVDVGGVTPGGDVLVGIGVAVGNTRPPKTVDVGVPNRLLLDRPGGSVGAPLASIVCRTAAYTAVSSAPGGKSVPLSEVFAVNRTLTVAWMSASLSDDAAAAGVKNSG